MSYTKNKKAFTLIEIMVWILIVSMVIVWWFQALSAITIWKTRLIQETDIQKESFYFTEKLFEMIKTWWVIDYEEYFNRKVIWDTNYLSWHFQVDSWFWNFWNNWLVWDVDEISDFWDWFYYCISKNWEQLTWSWCFDNELNSEWIDYSWVQQRYGQYSFQFLDYNSNYDNDEWNPWDEDWDWNIMGDDDDEYLWIWPKVFNSWENLSELYLISWNKLNRTLFRWKVEKDEYASDSLTCNVDSLNNTISWSWCLATVQYLKLEWRDRWMDHDLSITDSDRTQNDWVIDTWIIDREFSWWDEIVAWSDNKEYWVDLFPNTINVSKFEIFAFPNVDLNSSWQSLEEEENISPYLILKLVLEPSWITKQKIRSTWEKLDFSMTINLSDIYSK